MNRGAKGFRRWRVGVLASIAIVASTVAVVAGQGSAGATANKPFSVVICYFGQPSQGCPAGSPPVVSPGTSGTSATSVTATITDETTKGTGLTIGSVNLTAPSGVTPSDVKIASASFNGTLASCTTSTPATTSCISQDRTTLELRGLNVPPGGSITVSMGLATPPPPSSCTTTAPCQWSAAAKQSNDYNGPPGNQLNLDSNTSQLGIILSSEVTCTSAHKSNSCSTTLADGGATGSTGGSVSITTSATGTSGGIFYQSIDYGQHLPASDCSGIDSVHDEYISGPALNGSSARSFTVTITTTDYSGTSGNPGYQAEACITSSKQFTAKFISASGVVTTGPAPAITAQPDGTPGGFAGLLPNCTGDGPAPTVNCKSLPGVVSRSTSATVPSVHTLVASFPAGFDTTFRN